MSEKAEIDAPGALGARIEALRARHRALDAQVTGEQRRPMPDLARLKALKRDRLRLKDAIFACEGALRTVDRARRPARRA